MRLYYIYIYIYKIKYYIINVRIIVYYNSHSIQIYI